MDINPEILRRYFQGKYSRQDYWKIRSAFSDPAKEAELRNMLQKHWKEINTTPLPAGNIDHVLETIHQQIDAESTPTGRNRFIRTFQRIAAILVFPLLLAFLATFYILQSKAPSAPAMVEVQCPLGVRTQFELPDGTTGFLNSGSTLRYPSFFDQQRDVALDGEAFFDVTPDEARPFTVNTPHLSTKVLGTQFNVIAYENENREEIILQEGKVEVSSVQGRLLEKLQPNQKLVLNTETRHYNVQEAEAGQYTSWTRGQLVFRNESMQEVARRLGRWYNADIAIEDPELLNYAFRATFIDEPLEEVLRLLALTAPMKFEIQKRTTTGDEVYQKRKVSLKLDEERKEAF